MLEVIRLLVDIAGAIVPIRFVYPWQNSLYYVGGRYWFTRKRPGWLLIVPGLCEVKPVSMVPEIETTPLQTITLRDGRSLTYSASITVVVVDAYRAYNTVGHWSETVVELAARLVSMGLADAETDRFEPSRKKRDRLIEELRKELDDAVQIYGLSIPALGFTNFALGVRTIRLLHDQAVLNQRTAGGKDHFIGS